MNFQHKRCPIIAGTNGGVQHNNDCGKCKEGVVVNTVSGARASTDKFNAAKVRFLGQIVGAATKRKGAVPGAVQRSNCGALRRCVYPLLLLLVLTCIESVGGIFAPADFAALKLAVSGCLRETANGSCPKLSAIRGAVIGDYDVSNVTKMNHRTFATTTSLEIHQGLCFEILFFFPLLGVSTCFLFFTHTLTRLNPSFLSSVICHFFFPFFQFWFDFGLT